MQQKREPTTTGRGYSSATMLGKKLMYTQTGRALPVKHVCEVKPNGVKKVPLAPPAGPPHQQGGDWKPPGRSHYISASPVLLGWGALASPWRGSQSNYGVLVVTLIAPRSVSIKNSTVNVSNRIQQYIVSYLRVTSLGPLTIAMTLVCPISR